MFLPNDYTNSYYRPEGSGAPKSGIGLPGVAFSTRENVSLKQFMPVNMNSKTNRSNFGGNKAVFRKNMQEEEVKINLFIEEREEKFDKLTLRAKMTQIARLGDRDFIKWFYEMGSTDKLPKDWAGFKEAVISYCISSGLQNQRKFKEELWHEYIARLNEWADVKGYRQEDVIEKLRNENVSNKIRILFFQEVESLDKLTQLVKKWETVTIKRQASIKTTVKDVQVKSKMITCYGCGREGHTRWKCSSRGSKNLQGTINSVQNQKGTVDENIVSINNKKYIGLFDTGSSISLISKVILKDFKNVKTIKLTDPEKYNLINGEFLLINEKVALNVKYQNRNVKILFGILNDQSKRQVLLGNKEVKTLKGMVKKKNLNIECAIDTGTSGPIRNQQDLKSFKHW